MNAFVQKHSAVVTGVLSGFDRLVFRGTLRGLHGIPVMEQYRRTVKDDLQWRVLRRGVADLHRRAAVSDAANQRYVDALADVDADLPLGQQLDRLSRPTTWHGCRCRGLNLWGDDARLLAAITRGEFVRNGFRNRDLRTHLYGPPARDRNEEKRRSARVSRLLRLLRAHHLIKIVVQISWRGPGGALHFSGGRYTWVRSPNSRKRT